MDWGVIIAVATSALAATWVIANALAELGRKFDVHAAQNEAEHKAMKKDIVDIRAARAKKGR